MSHRFPQRIYQAVGAYYGSVEATRLPEQQSRTWLPRVMMTRIVERIAGACSAEDLCNNNFAIHHSLTS